MANVRSAKKGIGLRRAKVKLDQSSWLAPSAHSQTALGA